MPVHLGLSFTTLMLRSLTALVCLFGLTLSLTAAKKDKEFVPGKPAFSPDPETPAFDAAKARFGTVNSVVCNAGVGSGGRSTDVPVAGLRQVIDTNLLGAYLVAREGARRMIAAGSAAREDGRIVLIGSITAEQTGTGDAIYAATKAGIAHLTRQMAREWVRQGINVNTLQPGWISTEINAEWFATARGKADIAGLHRRRLLEPSALDDMLLYLLSDRSRQVTGATFTIDDGQSL